MIIALACVAHATSYFGLSDDPWTGFRESGDQTFSGLVVSSERRIVATLSGTADMLVTSIAVDARVRGTGADTVVVAWVVGGPFVPPNLGDHVIMSTSVWPVETSMSIVQAFVRSSPVPGGLGTVGGEGHWLGAVSCEQGFAPTNESADAAMLGAVDEPPRNAWDGPDLEKEERMMRRSVPWEIASSTVLRCLAD